MILTLVNTISNYLTTIEWLLMFFGWLFYWIKQLDTERRKDLKTFWSVPVKNFFLQNALELPVSGLSCLVLVLVAEDIPTELIDFKGKISLVIVGYTNSSLVNAILAYRKSAK